MPDEAARKNLEAYVASILPDVCKSPTAPVPYPVIIGTLDNSMRTESTVRFTSNEAFHAMSRVTMVTGDEAGVGGGVKSMKNVGYCMPTKWSSNVRTKGDWLVMHDVEFEMNCLTPDSPGNTKGKLIYVKCTAAAAITPAGEIVVDKPSEEGKSNSGAPSTESPESSGSSGGDDGGGGSDDNSTGKPASQQPDDSSLSEEEKKELEDLKRQQEEAEKEIEQLKDLAIEAGKALDPTPASDLYDMIQALQAGNIGAAVVAAAFVLLSLSPWKLLKMGRGAVKLAKIMKKLSKLMDKLKALKKKIAELMKKGASKAKKTIRISKVIPPKVRDVLDKIRKKNGAPPKGHKGGKTFENDGRMDKATGKPGEILPKTDADGRPITYKEYDVNPYQKGVDRGPERIVIGSDGNAYYTSNHYQTFTPID
ncbi:MAG: DUF4150 domain-containing protein [Planctomycetales bacterium]|nr:DUF4150 domain-containing protein [Planctomycetales bacterium]